jgi:cell division protein FtsZ
MLKTYLICQRNQSKHNMIEQLSSWQTADLVFICLDWNDSKSREHLGTVSKMVKQLGVFLIIIVVHKTPFDSYAQVPDCNTLLLIPLNDLPDYTGESQPITCIEAKKKYYLPLAIRGFVEEKMSAKVGFDFAEVHKLWSQGGVATLGVGFASGTDRDIKAANKALSCRNIEDIIHDSSLAQLSVICTDRSDSEIDNIAKLIRKKFNLMALYISLHLTKLLQIH